jgi:hypothetical protein
VTKHARPPREFELVADDFGSRRVEGGGAHGIGTMRFERWSDTYLRWWVTAHTVRMQAKITAFAVQIGTSGCLCSGRPRALDCRPGRFSLDSEIRFPFLDALHLALLAFGPRDRPSGAGFAWLLLQISLGLGLN